MNQDLETFRNVGYSEVQFLVRCSKAGLSVWVRGLAFVRYVLVKVCYRWSICLARKTNTDKIPSIISRRSGIVLPHCLVNRFSNRILLTLFSRHCLGSAQFRTQIRAQSFHCMVVLLKQFAEPFKQWNQRFLSLQCGNPVAGISSRDSPRWFRLHETEQFCCTWFARSEHEALLDSSHQLVPTTTGLYARGLSTIAECSRKPIFRV